MRLAILLSLVVTPLFGCGSIKAGLAGASAPRIRTCAAEQLQISDTYGGDPVKGPKWKATCNTDVYECQGYMQMPDTVRCQRLN